MRDVVHVTADDARAATRTRSEDSGRALEAEIGAVLRATGPGAVPGGNITTLSICPLVASLLPIGTLCDFLLILRLEFENFRKTAVFGQDLLCRPERRGWTAGNRGRKFVNARVETFGCYCFIDETHRSRLAATEHPAREHQFRSAMVAASSVGSASASSLPLQ